MSEEWKKKLKELKEKTETEILEIHRKEEELREKYKNDRNRLIELIYEQLKEVEEIYTEEDMNEYIRTKVIKHSLGANLTLPIKSASTTISLGINFNLHLSDKGYAVEVREDLFDSVKEIRFYTSKTIRPPVKINDIQDAISGFLSSRKQILISYEKKQQRLGRKYAF